MTIIQRYIKIILILSLSFLIFGCEFQEKFNLNQVIKTNYSDKLDISDNDICKDFTRYIKTNSEDRYLCKSGYVVNYNDSAKQAHWVAYRVTGESLSSKIPREEKFSVDLSIPKAYRAELSDYKNSGYDRGHLTPYASIDFSIASANQSFLLSNMSPQKPGLNRHGWAQLEKYERFWARLKSEIYVYTGVIYKNKKPRTFIGKNKVAVPDYFYKVIYAPKKDEIIAFIMPNSLVDKKDVAKYRVSVKEIEQRTGYKFFMNVSSTQKNKVSPMWRTSLSKN